MVRLSPSSCTFTTSPTAGSPIAEMELINEAGREYILRELLEPIREDYDYIIIDCPPSLGLLTLNALTSSDVIYIPLQAEFLAMQGLAKIKQVIDKVRFRLNKGLHIGGVIATMYDARKVLNRDVVQTIKKYTFNSAKYFICNEC